MQKYRDGCTIGVFLLFIDNLILSRKERGEVIMHYFDELDELLEIAYRRGLGVSRKHVPAIRQLWSRSNDSARTRNSDYQLITKAETYQREFGYLGARLAQRAFQNLPKKYRDAAKNWQFMDAESQAQLLKGMLTDFSGDQWYAQLQTRQLPESSASPFPHETKSWTRGPIPLSCLGLAEMLVGFARAAGADHWLVTPAKTLSEEIFQDRIQGVTYIEQFLEGAPPAGALKAVRRRINKLRTEAMDLLKIVQDAPWHHALLIRDSDERIHYVDPYLDGYEVFGPRVIKSYRSCKRPTAPTPREIFGPASYEILRQKSRRFPCFSRSESLDDTPLGQCLELAWSCISMTPTVNKERVRHNLYRLQAETLYCMIDCVLSTTDKRIGEAPSCLDVTDSDVSLAAYVLNDISSRTGIGGAGICAVSVSEHIACDQRGELLRWKDDLLVGFLLKSIQSEPFHEDHLPELAHFKALLERQENG